MLERAVSIDGVIYRQHEVIEIRHAVDGTTRTLVRSAAAEAVVHTIHEVSDDLAMTFEEAEAETFALPFFDEVEDPYAEVVEEQAAQLAEQAQLIDEVSEILTDEQAADLPAVFPEWAVGVAYKYDDRRRYAGELYKCIQPHTSQADYTPDVAVSLWVKIAKPGEIPVWRRPTGAHDAYNTGDKVHYETAEDPVYRSTKDANVYSPAEWPEGWELVEEE